MIEWWVIVHVPGWVASQLLRLPEASVVSSLRRITQYTDKTTAHMDMPCDVRTGEHRVTYAHTVTSEDCMIQCNGTEYDCQIHHITQVASRTTDGILSIQPTTYWRVHTPDGEIQVHKRISDDTSIPTQWTVEMKQATPDGVSLRKTIQKYISIVR